MGERERARAHLRRAYEPERGGYRGAYFQSDRATLPRGQVAYHRLLQLPYIPLLISSLKDLFLSLYTPAIRTLVDALRSTSAEASSAALQELNRALEGWDKVWEKLLKRVESESGDAPGGVKMRRVSGLRESAQPETPELRTTRSGGRRTPGGLSGRASPAPESPYVLEQRPGHSEID